MMTLFVWHLEYGRALSRKLARQMQIAVDEEILADLTVAMANGHTNF